MGIDENRLYSVTEVAEIFRVTRGTMERYIKEVPIEYINLTGGKQFPALRILGSTLISFLEKNTVTGERKPPYDAKTKKSSIFRSLQGRC